ncbi:P-loop nucleotide/nucleoside kinase family protein [Ferruginibacter sp.]
MRVLIFTIGKTAVGKTTLAKRVAKKLKFEYLSEGSIKKSLVEKYTYKESLSETLRNFGYKKTIKMSTVLLKNKNVIIDASFHKKFRRKWLYDSLRRRVDLLVAIYIDCPNKTKIISRINKRKLMPKNSENQADSIKVYNKISKEFNVPNITEFSIEADSAIIFINTDTNEISKTQIKIKNKKSELFFTKLIKHIIKNLGK